MIRSFLLRAALFLCAAFFVSGCAFLSYRSAPFKTLATEPMDAPQWAQVAGIYTGPVRASTRRFGTEGVRVFEIRLELFGHAESPDVFLKIITAHSGAWTAYSEKLESYTNIPERRYGTQGDVFASSHAPDQLVLRLRHNGPNLDVRPTMTLTFRGRGHADVEWLGSNGWHGEGTLHRVPVFVSDER